jgi:hypothetical protein
MYAYVHEFIGKYSVLFSLQNGITQDLERMNIQMNNVYAMYENRTLTQSNF